MRWLALLALAACGGSAAPTTKPVTTSPAEAAKPGPDLEAELARVRALADRACACPDDACLAEVDRAYAAYLDVATLIDPVDGTTAWPEGLRIDAEDAVNQMFECYGAASVAMVEGVNRYEIRVLEMFGDHACACPDDACLGETCDAFANAEVGEMYATGDPQLVDRIRGAMTKVGRCLGPVLEDELAALTADLESRRQQACTCADATCGGLVAGELMTWMAELDLVTAALVTHERVQALLVEISTCLSAVKP